MIEQPRNHFQQVGASEWPNYQPYYCEENIYRLAARMSGGNHSALFISNPHETCALMHQRAASPGQMIVWDYHVVLLLTEETEQWIVDFDTRLARFTSADTYLRETFGVPVPPWLRPKFRLVGSAEFLGSFSTDRRHMRGTNGWIHEPPYWDSPCGPQAASPHELPRFLNTTESGPGCVFTLPELTDYLSVTTVAPEHRTTRRQ